jgi:transposase
LSYEFVTDQVWERIHPLLPDANSFGRPRCKDRDVIEGILWVLKTGARWRDQPKTLPSASTCWRRLRDWEEQGVWDAVWRNFIRQLDAAGVLDWEQCFMDGSLDPAKNRGLGVGKTKQGKGTNWRVVADGKDLPVGGAPSSASPAEVTLAIPTLSDCKARASSNWPVP